MTNPANAIRILITYGVCIPLAIMVGYLLTDPLDYGSLGVFGLIALLLLSPIFIRWHYPIMIFVLGCPAFAFFLKGDPPMWQVAVILSFGIAVVERAMNNERRFISPAIVVWPMLFTVAVVYMTAKLTGGIGLKSLGGGDNGVMGGGKKYIEVFLGVMCFFALTSRTIPVERRRLYVALYFLGGLPAFVADLFPVLPGPLKYINLLIPPSGVVSSDTTGLATRLGSFSVTAGVVVNYLVARHGLRGILLHTYPFRALLFVAALYLSLMGGFRISMITDGFVLGLIFFMEGLHRTRLLMVVVFIGIIGTLIVIPFAKHMPYSVQRSLSFLPLDLDPDVKQDADGSAEWRHKMWGDLWPRVPGYLLLGKGYALTAEDFANMGNGADVGLFHADSASAGLAVSGDYHNGPLSTLIPFGVWGAISIIWLLAVATFITYRNMKYSVPELQTVNTFFFASSCWHIVCFCFVFGAYGEDVLFIGRTVGFSVALNWGIRAAKPVSSFVRSSVKTSRRGRVAPPQPQTA